MAYLLINQNRIDDILDSGFNLPISTDIMETNNIIGNCDNISLEGLNNIGGAFYIIDKRNVIIKKCDLEVDDNISIKSPWCIEINENTLRNIIIEELITYAEIKNNYINKLNICNCKTSGTIVIQSSIIDELSIDSCLLRNGIYISIDSTIKNIIVKDSIIDNTSIINSNIISIVNMTDEQNNIENNIYEEIFENIAIKNFKMSRSLIINNNANNTLGYVEETKNKLNVREYIEKNNCMIAGYYSTNNSDEK